MKHEERLHSTEERLLKRIVAKGEGWAFSAKDFTDLVPRRTIDSSLHRLTKWGSIRRVMTGVYDLPVQSQVLRRAIAPDIDQVAQALARKFGWEIQASGPSAQNLIGLSNQVPAKFIYLSDGPKRRYNVGAATLQFERTALKDARFKLRESSLLVQAIKDLEPSAIDAAVVRKLRAWLKPELRSRVRKDTQIVTGWVHEVIRRVTEESARG